MREKERGAVQEPQLVWMHHGDLLLASVSPISFRCASKTYQGFDYAVVLVDMLSEVLIPNNERCMRFAYHDGILQDPTDRGVLALGSLVRGVAVSILDRRWYR